MLDKLTKETFDPHVGSSFWLIEGKHKVELRLVKTAKVMESEAAQLDRHPFSIFFLGPHGAFLDQRIYHLEHDGFAEPLDIFLVPVSREDNGYLYEAVFT